MPVNYDICVIKSESKNLAEVECFLINYFKINLLSPDIFNRIYLCISEAVMNSIIHGNKNNPVKEIKIKVKLNKKNLMVSVIDEGEGFNYLKIEDPTKNENLKKEFGRGIHIIKSFTASLKYRKNCCFLRFKI
jgi:serine/threonine-protein kinase RsbW